MLYTPPSLYIEEVPTKTIDFRSAQSMPDSEHLRSPAAGARAAALRENHKSSCLFFLHKARSVFLRRRIHKITLMS